MENDVIKKYDVYQELTCAIDDAFRLQKDEKQDAKQEEKEIGKLGYTMNVAKVFLGEKQGVFIVTLLFVLTFLHMIVLTYWSFYGMAHLTTVYTPNLLIYYFLWTLIPFGIWAWSTRYDYYNYHNRKLRLFNLMIINGVIALGTAVFRYTAPILFTIFSLLPTNPDVTPVMVASLAKLTTLIFCLAPSMSLLWFVLEQANNEMTVEHILGFKMLSIYDTRKDKQFAYDMKVVRNLKTGAQYVIKEKDRSLHSLVNGTTGSGKTSSINTNAINDDMEQIVYNLNYQKKTIKKWLNEGRVRMLHPMSDATFNIDNFEPVHKKDKDIINKLKWKAKLAGITAMAPNEGFSDEIYGLSQKAGLTNVYRLDPILDKSGHLKEGFIGFNPLYMNPHLTKMNWMLEVSRIAVMFADVMQAIYATSGQTNPYFASLNRNLTTTVTMLVIITYPELNNKKQPTPEHVQLILNDFGKAKPYREKLVEMFAKKDNAGNIIRSNGRPVLSNFQVVLDVVDTDLLGPQADRIFEQSGGLRIIINSFLTNPLIKNILCNERSIDLDEILEKGAVVLVNYALELGTDSRAFGLFFLLSFINAVYRRPGTENTRIPNFMYVDEFPTLLHPAVSSCFELFRQYRVPMCVSIQSLSQMEKMKETAYLKQLLLGSCAHHFVFGRVAVEEMKMYQELAGTSLQLTIQDGIKESPIISDNPSVMYDHRETVKRDINIYGSQMRNLGFQEVTVFTVNNGSPVDVFFGKTRFLPKYKRIKKPNYVIDLSKVKPLTNEFTDKDNENIEHSSERVSEIISSYGEVVSENRTIEMVEEYNKETVVQLPKFMEQLAGNEAKKSLAVETMDKEPIKAFTDDFDDQETDVINEFDDSDEFELKL